MIKQIYTSYYGQLKNLQEDNIYPVSISLFTPAYFELMGYPSWKTVNPTPSILHQIKSSEHSEDDIQRYNNRYLLEVLGKYKPEYLVAELNSLVPDNVEKVALLCYEQPGRHCHRWLLSDWLNRHIPELKIKEYKYNDKSVESFSLF